MGFTVERSGFIQKGALITQLIKDLVANGFTPIWYDNGSISDDVEDILATKAVLEASSSVDPLYETQPWRLCIDGLVTGCRIILGTNLQILDTGICHTITGAIIPATETATATNISGLIGHNGTDSGLVSDAYLNPASPYSYRLSITDRGFAVEFFQEVMLANDRHYSFVCVQRLVDPTTGTVQVTGRCPVIALYSCDSGLTCKRIVVREIDVLAPTESAIVSAYSDYVNQVINVSKQVVLSETNQYYIIFPSGFNTPRFLYNEEMDMVAFTSSGVLSQFNDAVVNVYGRGVFGFEQGVLAPEIGDLVTDTSTGAICTVYAVNLISGSWANGDAIGTIKFYGGTGDFVHAHNFKNYHTNAPIGKINIDSQLEYRSYKAGCANIPDAEGMRMLYLVNGGGI